MNTHLKMVLICCFITFPLMGMNGETSTKSPAETKDQSLHRIRWSGVLQDRTYALEIDRLIEEYPLDAISKEITDNENLDSERYSHIALAILAGADVEAIFTAEKVDFTQLCGHLTSLCYEPCFNEIDEHRLIKFLTKAIKQEKISSVQLKSANLTGDLQEFPITRFANLLWATEWDLYLSKKVMDNRYPISLLVGSGLLVGGYIVWRKFHDNDVADEHSTTADQEHDNQITQE